MKRRKIILCVLVAGLLMAGCATQETQTAQEATQEPVQEAREAVAKAATTELDGRTLTDRASLYQEYDPYDPVYFYITVVGGTEADGTNHTFAEVNLSLIHI